MEPHYLHKITLNTVSRINKDSQEEDSWVLVGLESEERQKCGEALGNLVKKIFLLLLSSKEFIRQIKEE